MDTDREPPLGSIGNPVRFRGQNFKKLLEECLKSGKLFSDPTFPAEQASIGVPEDPDPKKEIKWQRPKVRQHSSRPALLLVVDTRSQLDLQVVPLEKKKTACMCHFV